MKKYRHLILGIVAGAVIFNSVPAAAETFSIVFNFINITVNGKKVEADNILYKDTTYVPLRAVAEMLDKNVSWDDETRTASIDDKDRNHLQNGEDNETVETAADSPKILKSGEYVVGRDIEAGKYNIKATSGRGHFAVYEKGKAYYKTGFYLGVENDMGSAYKISSSSYSNLTLNTDDTVIIKDSLEVEISKTE